jgi:hypothetical protein
MRPIPSGTDRRLVSARCGRPRKVFPSAERELARSDQVGWFGFVAASELFEQSRVVCFGLALMSTDRE